MTSLFCFKSNYLPCLCLCSAAAFLQPSSAQASDTELGGLLMLDLLYLDELYRGNDSSYSIESEIRRARLDLKHRLNNDWKAKLQVNFDAEESSAEIGDAYVRYQFDDASSMTLGQTKQAMGLERLTSSKNSTFLERSMISNAFGGERNKGINLARQNERYSLSLGAYELPVHEDSDDLNASPYAVTARLTWAPLAEIEKTLHFGLSSSLRDMDGSLYEVNQRSEVHLSEKLVSSGEIAADSVSLLGLEAAWSNGPFSLQSEYMRADLEAVDSSEDAALDGFYIQSSWFLNGAQRSYKNGIFGSVKSIPEDGAWELAARYSTLNTGETEKGNEAQSATLGLNYYYSKDLRIMANLIHTTLVEEEAQGDEGSALSMRLQYAF